MGALPAALLGRKGRAELPQLLLPGLRIALTQQLIKCMGRSVTLGPGGITQGFKTVRFL